MMCHYLVPISRIVNPRDNSNIYSVEGPILSWEIENQEELNKIFDLDVGLSRMGIDSKSGENLEPYKEVIDKIAKFIRFWSLRSKYSSHNVTMHHFTTEDFKIEDDELSTYVLWGFTDESFKSSIVKI